MREGDGRPVELSWEDNVSLDVNNQRMLFSGSDVYIGLCEHSEALVIHLKTMLRVSF